jgi:hypothetical protein
LKLNVSVIRVDASVIKHDASIDAYYDGVMD